MSKDPKPVNDQPVRHPFPSKPIPPPPPDPKPKEK